MTVEIQGPGPVPEDALAFFVKKKLRPGFDYRDVWRQEHAFAFTVAKAMELDVLTDIRDQVQKAIAAGQTLRQFQKQLEPILADKGWWGRREAVDPLTGEIKDVQLGSPHRLKTIYDANIRTAHAAGQWQRAERTKDALPYLLYSLGPSREHRPDHAAWHGTLLPVDDPWWDSHMPPNGWGCKCRVRQVSRPEHERLVQRGVPATDRRQLVNPETGRPTGRFAQTTQPVRTTAPEIRYRQWKNRRTGRVEMVPEGIDPGWDTNPGKSRAQGLEAHLAEKMRGADPLIAAAIKKDMERYREAAKAAESK